MFKLQVLDNPSRSIWLVGEKITLGSDKTNQLVLGSLGSEEFHAEIIIAEDTLSLNSLNGRCYVNGLLADNECGLKAGDVLRIGKETLQIVDSLSLALESPVKDPVFDRFVEQTGEVTWVLIPKHPALKNREYAILDKSLLGRSGDCDICIPHKKLSREHAQITVENKKLIVRDLDSSNGVYHNGIKIKQGEFVKGDTLTFANLEFSVELRIKDDSHDTVQTNEMPESMNETMIRPVVDIKAEIIRLNAASVGRENPPRAASKSGERSDSIPRSDGQFGAESTLTADRNDIIGNVEKKEGNRGKLARVVIFGVIVTVVVAVLIVNFGIF